MKQKKERKGRTLTEMQELETRGLTELAEFKVEQARTKRH